MGTQAVAGTVIKFATTKPATQDQAGYESLTWQGFDNCVLTNVGDYDGKEYSIIDTETVCDRQTKHAKGSFTWPEFSIEMLQDRDDPAQALLKAALDSDDDISIQLTEPDGHVLYFFGLVTQFMTNAGGVNDMLRKSLTIKPRMSEYVHV